jgi:glycosyltransferase involved in cell wall biosynthesis
MTNSPNPRVSVVTPVYNEEHFLAQSIESVLAQTYENWDLTIVDNCSADKSLEIARRYAEQDTRIRVIVNQKHLDLIPNHNLALQQLSPQSKYCKVVFADDWIFPQCLEKMVAVAEANSTVGLVSAYEQCGQEIRMMGLPADQTVVNGKKACRLFLLRKVLLLGSPNSALYRSDLVRARSPFYLETEMFADFESSFALLQESDLGFVHDVLTFSRPRSGSAGSVSADTGAFWRCLLSLLREYGKGCLTPEEYEQSRETWLGQYYKFLARRLLVEHSKNFWTYQLKAFESVGLSLDRKRLLKTTASELSSSILDPKSVMRSMKRLVSLRKIRNPSKRGIVSGFDSGGASDTPLAAKQQ